jgi:UDP-4-amino-4,6-dideoxy-N-acetyl-beta-L-altrosamine transaminase
MYIPYGRQSISDADVQAVVDTLRSDWLTQGPAVERFEHAVSEYCDARHAVAVNSGTSALHIACLAAGLRRGDILWTSPITFVASANCALYCGATVDFVDIDPRTYNMSASALEAKLIKARQDGTLPKIVVPVHFSGQPCEMARIAELGREFGFTIIEDASHAIGARYLGKTVGNSRYSDMTVFSFHPVKLVTTAEGGMVVTNRSDVFAHLSRLRSHGITRDASLMDGESHGNWYYQQIELGYNYRMTDLQAALGVSQMARLDEFVARRHELASRYNRMLMNLPLTLPWQSPNGCSAFHLYIIKIDSARTEVTRRQVFDAMRNAHIGVNVHYIPVHTQPFYRNMGFTDGMFPEAEGYYANTISLPVFAGMTDGQQDRVVDVLMKCMTKLDISTER